MRWPILEYHWGPDWLVWDGERSKPGSLIPDTEGLRKRVLGQ
jgi:hypothetical protein